MTETVAAGGRIGNLGTPSPAAGDTRAAAVRVVPPGQARIREALISRRSDDDDPERV
jgi:hypothetical protein